MKSRIIFCKCRFYNLFIVLKYVLTFSKAIVGYSMVGFNEPFELEMIHDQRASKPFHVHH